jgi:hypothetical protein
MEETRKPPRKPRAKAAAPAASKPAPKAAAKAARPATPVKAAARKQAAPAVPTQPERDQMVRMAAYFRAQQRGFAPGNEWEDWLAAEAEISALVEPAAPPAKSRKAPPRKTSRG